MRMWAYIERPQALQPQKVLPHAQVVSDLPHPPKTLHRLTTAQTNKSVPRSLNGIRINTYINED
jgi:hypothetical protein